MFVLYRKNNNQVPDYVATLRTETSIDYKCLHCNLSFIINSLWDPIFPTGHGRNMDKFNTLALEMAYSGSLRAKRLTGQIAKIEDTSS